MKQSGRILAAIELLDEIFSFRQPADNTVNAYFRTRRYIGGGDRREISALVWFVLRRYGRLRLSFGKDPTGREAVAVALRYRGTAVDPLFDGDKYSPAPLTAEERAALARLPDELPDAVAECPDWLRGRIDGADVLAMVDEAPLDLRVNTLKSTREDVLKLLERSGIKAEKTPYSPVGVRVNGRANVTALPVYADGLVEIQDEGSQIVSLLTQAAAGQVAIDWCAGGGGKTLVLSAMMNAKGTIYAADANARRLRDLPERAARAGANNVILLNDYKSLKQYDLVLVDAPCTGTGTWRRSADARWRMSPEQSAQIIETQREILDKACRCVKKGGRLFYVTCSLDAAENEDQAAAFIQNHADFVMEDLAPVLKKTTGLEQSGKTIRLRPSVCKTDGFFAASFIKK